VSDDNFLSRWSRRKHQVRQGVPLEEPPAPAPLAPVPSPAPATSEAQSQPEDAPIPPVESLTPESDFSPFMRAQVDPGVRTQALKTLFQDPRFNVMDGLDVYIDDYSKPDPLPEGWLEKMSQVARLGAYEPPKEEPESERPAAAAAPSEEAAARPEEAIPAQLGEADRVDLAGSAAEQPEPDKPEPRHGDM
jgi:hypothetical protein